MKQPRVPEYREGDSVSKYLKNLILFLKDFSMETWKADDRHRRDMTALTGGDGTYAFDVNEDGHLICTYEQKAPQLHIDGNGHLIYTYTVGEEG